MKRHRRQASPGGGIGRRAGFRYQWCKPWRFESSPGHQRSSEALIRKVFRQSNGLIAPECYTRVLHMVLSMSRPTKRKTTGVYYFRKRVPADLVPIVGRREI